MVVVRLTGRIMIAYVEHMSLTLREHVPPLLRRTLVAGS